MATATSWRRLCRSSAAALACSAPARRALGFLARRFQPNVRPGAGLAFPFVRPRRSGNLQILIYHRVNDERDPFFPAIPVAVFARHMAYVASELTVLPLEEAVQRLRARDLPTNAAVVTFDDGYKDNRIHAFPILRQHSIPFTVFLATDAIGTGRAVWHDQVFSAFRDSRADVLALGREHRYELGTLDARVRAQGAILDFLRTLHPSERSRWIERLADALGSPLLRAAPRLMLNWDDVRAMAGEGVSFGCHTASHPILSRLSGDEVRDEIVRAQQAIEKELGAPARTFAYPNGGRGDFDDTTKGVLRELGFACAVTTIFGVNESDQDPLELRRGQPWEHDLATFASKLHWYRFSTSHVPAHRGGGA